MDTKPTVLITGATGKQGGAVIEYLQKSAPDTYNIHALTRNPSSPQAQRLTSRWPGITLVKGDLNDVSTLPSALQGVTAAFLVTDFRCKGGVEAETAQGKSFIDECAKTAGFKHLVFTSVCNAEAPVPHFHSKLLVEEYLKSQTAQGKGKGGAGFSYTILRPYAFMDNLHPNGGLVNAVMLGIFDAGLQGKGMQWIACEDIGVFGGKALAGGSEWEGRTIDLAGDMIDVEGMRKAYEKVWGVRPWKIWVPWFVLYLGLPGEMSSMFKYFREEGCKKSVDIPTLRQVNPEMLTFEKWVKKGVEQK